MLYIIYNFYNATSDTVNNTDGIAGANPVAVGATIDNVTPETAHII